MPAPIRLRSIIISAASKHSMPLCWTKRAAASFRCARSSLAVEGKTDPRAKLEAALDVVVQTLLGPVSSSWVLQVFGRDMVTPSPTTYAAKEKLILP